MKIIITLACLILSVSGFAQKTYLKISRSKKTNDYVMYPPGTKFELKNKHGYIVFKNSDKPGKIEINENYTLYVFPDWKSDTDVYKLTEGKIEKILTSTYSNTQLKEASIKTHEVIAEYSVRDSKKLKDKKNLKFELSNGITFEYNDGKYKAYLHQEENYIDIEGKYLITSDLGTLKLSFNQKNGQVWWVFEPKK